jgi:hypothetical protein
MKSATGIRKLILAAIAVVSFFASGNAASAQQTTGTPGSPDATTTVDSRYLPAPPQKFDGQISLNVAQSKPAWPARSGKVAGKVQSPSVTRACFLSASDTGDYGKRFQQL